MSKLYDRKNKPKFQKREVLELEAENAHWLIKRRLELEAENARWLIKLRNVGLLLLAAGALIILATILNEVWGQ